jgi:cytochrome c-type biogenesis protein CcmH/NrfF
MTMRFVLLALVCVACAAPRGSAATEAHRIEAQVWSPYCPGRLLIDCTTQQADDLRGQIAQRLRSGQSPDDVMRFIRLNFGDGALARPSGRDTLLVWSFPLALFVIGVPLLVFLLRRWTRTRTLPLTRKE